MAGDRKAHCESYFVGRSHLVYTRNTEGKEGLVLAFGDESGHLRAASIKGEFSRYSCDQEPSKETVDKAIHIDTEHREFISKKLSPEALSMWDKMVEAA